jgi:hypothetical protein
VARRLGRKWIGIEREPSYVKVARERIDATLPLDESAMTVMADKRSQPRVAFGLLVESGMVPAGSRLTDSKRRWSASVNADGAIACDGQTGSIHKIGATLQGAPSCNGWTFWHVEHEGRLQPIDALAADSIWRRYRTAECARLFGPRASSIPHSAMTASVARLAGALNWFGLVELIKVDGVSARSHRNRAGRGI